MSSIAIIVPIFNGARYLPYFYESLAAAIPSEAELILVDDCSTEPVLELFPSDFPAATVRKLRNDENRGYSAAVNRGFSEAKSDILVQLNTDLILDPDCIVTMVDLIESKPKAGIVGSKQLFPTNGLVRHIGMAFGLHSFRRVYSGMPSSHPLCTKTRSMQIVSGATVAMSRRVLAAIGPLDEGYFNTHEDLDHCLKAISRGFVNYTAAESVTYHWVSQSGPARFAKVQEGDAVFWGEWSSRRSVDLNRFVDEALTHVLETHPQLARYDFKVINLCRSSDEVILLDAIAQRWAGIENRVHHVRPFNNPDKNVWLPMELPHRAMLEPSPYIYLIDHHRQLSENHLWLRTRRNTVEEELILDLSAAALTTSEFLALCEGAGA